MNDQQCVVDDVRSDIVVGGFNVGQGFLLTELPRRLPRKPNGKRIHVATCFRWADPGILAPDGETRVKLETYRVGRAVYTDSAAVERFLQRLANPLAVLSPKPVQAHVAKAVHDRVSARLRGRKGASPKRLT